MNAARTETKLMTSRPHNPEHRADESPRGCVSGRSASASASASVGQRGFTLVEIMTVVAILGIMAALAIAAYTKNVRNARRTEVIGNLSNIALRQNALMSARGHYASTGATENDTYPVLPQDLAAQTGAIQWYTSDAGYNTRRHRGRDPLLPRRRARARLRRAATSCPTAAARGACYGTISGDGTNGEFGDEPPNGGLGGQVFASGNPQLERFYARDWFYAFAKCDFDRDGVFWEFTNAHFRSDVSMGDTNYGE